MASAASNHCGGAAAAKQLRVLLPFFCDDRLVSKRDAAAVPPPRALG
jgi:hypothetical protein